MIAIGVVRRFGRLVQLAEEEIIKDMNKGKVETEPSITDRYLAVLEHIINEQWDKEGLTLDLRTLGDRGRNAPESKYGADFVAVLNVELKGFKQTKGFLCQAKRESASMKVLKAQPQQFTRGPTAVDFRVNNEFLRLQGQANNLLDITPASFVIVYSEKGFVVVPATAVTSLNANNKLYAKSAVRFFKEFLMCFIGDPRIKAWDDASLEKLMDQYRAKRAVMFSLRQTNFDRKQSNLETYS